MVQSFARDVVKDIATEAARGAAKGAFGALQKKVIPKAKRVKAKVTKPKARAKARKRSLW